VYQHYVQLSLEHIRDDLGHTYIESRRIASINGFVNGRSIAQSISRQRVLGFQKAWPFSFFVLHPPVENSSFSATMISVCDIATTN
jgi:hypothetical protein